MVLLVCMIPNIVVLMNTSMVNNAAPTIMNDLGVEISSFQWVENAFLLTITVLLLASGRLADIVGLKKLFILGNLLLVIGSVLTVLGLSVPYMILTQFIAGVGGTLALATALPLLIIQSPPEHVGRRIGLWASGATLGAAIGPFAAGYMTKLFGWQTIFLLPALLSLIAIFGAMWVLNESRNDAEEKKMDWLGAALLCLGLVALVFGMTQIGQVSAGRVVGILCLAISFLLAFVFVQSRSKHPLIRLSLLKNRVLLSMNIAVATCYFAMMGGLFLISYYMQSVLLFEPTKSGLTAIPFAITGILMAPVAANAAERFGARIVTTIGLGIFGCVCAVAAEVNPQTGFWILMALSFLQGFATGIVSSAATVGAMQPIPPDVMAVASGYFGTWRQLGKSLGVAVIGGLLFTQFATRDLKIFSQENPGLPASELQALEAQVLGSSHGGAGPGVAQSMIDQANDIITNAYKDSMIVIAVVCAIAAILVFIVGKPTLPTKASEDPDLDEEIEHEHEREAAAARTSSTTTAGTSTEEATT